MRLELLIESAVSYKTTRGAMSPYENPILKNLFILK